MAGVSTLVALDMLVAIKLSVVSSSAKTGLPTDVAELILSPDRAWD